MDGRVVHTKVSHAKCEMAKSKSCMSSAAPVHDAGDPEPALPARIALTTAEMGRSA